MDKAKELERKVNNILCECGEIGITEEMIKEYLKDVVEDLGKMSYFHEGNNITFYDTCREIFHYEILNWCGCENPEEADSAVLKYLNCLSYTCYGSDTEFESIPLYNLRDIFGGQDDPLLLCLMYMMDSFEFTDHGSSIYGSWLTTKGYIFRLCLRRWRIEQDALDENCGAEKG